MMQRRQTFQNHFFKASLDGASDILVPLGKFLAPTARMQGVTVNWQAEPDLPPVSLDVELFEKALLNLMLNAEDAVLDVIDTGAGIPDDVLPTLFRPFMTTKPDGNGLGLATAKKIILAHGGDIAVQSEVGRGTKFTVRLPAE